MFELTNEQRKCFGLPRIQNNWEKLEVPPSPLDMYYTYAYLDGNRIRKIIQVYDEQPGQHRYEEYHVDELVSEDRAFILPKTPKGKLQKFTASNLMKRTRLGMSLWFFQNHISLRNDTSCKGYYSNAYDKTGIDTLPAFSEWVNHWCEETTSRDLAELSAFALEGREHHRYREGDFFRFKLNRRLFGYGRILLDYAKLRKQGVPYWNIFMGKALCVAVYHIITDDPNLSIDDLTGKMMLPSLMIMDDEFYYGENPIIGNAPLAENEMDYPVHYGNTISRYEQGVRYQCGKTFIAMDDQKELFAGFIHNEISLGLNVSISVLQECIEKHSNAPYWEKSPAWFVNRDLRNPKFAELLRSVRKQVGVER